MAKDDELEEGEEDGVTGVVPNGKPPREYKAHDEGTTTDEEEDEDEEDEEPLLKYATLTKQLGSIYRNGDATSVFLVAGDKMVKKYLLQTILRTDDWTKGSWNS